MNRKISESQKLLKEKELEGKTEAEQAEALRLEKEQIQKEIEELNRGRLVDKQLDSAGLPLDFAKRIVGNDEANIKEDIKNFNDFINNLAQERADKLINERMGGKAPEGGANPTKDNIDVLIKKAQQAGDFIQVMALKEQKKQQLRE